MYKDDNGAFTQYLRDNCVGGFTPYIFERRNMQTSPVEYYLEVKSTTGRCGTRFYMSGKQYERVCEPKRVDLRVIRMENHANSRE